MKKILTISLFLFIAQISSAQNVTDSLKSRELQEVVVEAKLQQTSATVSTYYPTVKQKESAQTGNELINRMAIPQLRISDGSKIETSDGKAVSVFINYLPASRQDLVGMRTTDVRKVEYYDYPADPRFQGAVHVVNFIMQRYEYGGYVKGYANQSFIVNSGQLNVFSKLQYKNMTYDVAAGENRMNSDHNGYEKTEYYRLPQTDGGVITFDRISSTTESKLERRNYWTTFKAVYQTDRIVFSNVFAADFERIPQNNQYGTVAYTRDFLPASNFLSSASNRINSFTYNGLWNFIISSNNIITVVPYYSYSHTNQWSDYVETGYDTYVNGAMDNTHQGKADISFSGSSRNSGAFNLCQ